MSVSINLDRSRPPAFSIEVLEVPRSSPVVFLEVPAVPDVVVLGAVVPGGLVDRHDVGADRA